MNTKDIIYLLLLIVNVFFAFYMGILAWKEGKNDNHIKLAVPVFLGLSVLGITQIYHLIINEDFRFTIKYLCDIVQLLSK
jgi:hypothetical protein